MGTGNRAATQERCKGLTLHEIEDLEKEITIAYAKTHHLWIEDFYALGELPLVGGHENTLMLDKDARVVYKRNNLLNTKRRVSLLLQKIALHNSLFPETRYTLVGFTGLPAIEGRPLHLEVVLQQDYIPGLKKASFDEIKSYMRSIGFYQVTHESYRKDHCVVFDLYPRNVLTDDQGVIYVVDAEIVLIDTDT